MTKTKRSVCPSLTRCRSAWWHFIRARANCLAIVAMLFNRRPGDRFNIYDVSDGNIKLTNIVNIAMILMHFLFAY